MVDLKTSIANAYVELQTGIITIITIVLAINQLILSPDLGPISRQRQRLTDVIDIWSEVEDIADKTISPAEPSAFLGTIVDGLQKASTALRTPSPPSTMTRFAMTSNRILIRPERTRVE